MKQRVKRCFALGLASLFLFAGCQGEAVSENVYAEEHTVEEAAGEAMPASGAEFQVTMPEASGEVTYGENGVTIDASHTADGYVMVKCEDDSAILKVILEGPNGTKYTYDLNGQGVYETYGLSDGNGIYSVGIYQNIEGAKYAVLFSQEIEVALKDPFLPFLCPNQYVDYTAESEAVKLAGKLTAGLTDELEQVQAIYDYVIKNISYDTEKARNVKSGYLPDIDAVLAEKKGICFDYAALMTAMLRSQGVPTKLVTGYTGSSYHAWISTYSEETGWVEGVIFFDGTTWKLMDPTFASSGGSSEDIMEYIGDGKNYKEKYLY